MVYVVDQYHHCIQKFTPGGRFVLAWGKKGKVNVLRSAVNFLLPANRKGEFYYPSRIAIGPNDHIYVSDAYNNRVQVFNADGHWLQSIGGLGLWGGRFRVTAGLAVAGDGSVFVGDFYNNRIEQFDRHGGFVRTWPGFHGPTGVAMDARGHVLVVEWKRHRITRFRP